MDKITWQRRLAPCTLRVSIGEDKMNKKRKDWKKYGFLLLIMLIVLGLFPFSVKFMNEALLNNAQRMGDEIARRFAINEETYLNQYETVLRTVEYQIQNSADGADLSDMLEKYKGYTEETMELNNIELYGYIDGKMEAATYWEGDETFDPGTAQWYQEALASKGEVIYTSVYTDVRLQRQVVTIAKELGNSQDVIALDVYLDGIALPENVVDLPQGCNYFLCDQDGMLIDNYLSSGSGENLQERFLRIFQEIQEGKHDRYDSYIIGTEGEKRGVYYYALDSGWYTVITMPYDELLSATDNIWLVFGPIAAGFVILSGVYLILDHRSNKKARLYNDVVGVLGNSYYALYMINLKEETYSMLKGSDYVRSELPPRGEYRDLLKVMSEVIHEDVYEEYIQTFSIENMRELTKRRVRDFGGDFKRLFNNEYRWVHVQMLYDESLKQGSVVLCFRDVNDKKEEDLSRLKFLKQSLENVDKMAKSKNMFFSLMSHDMRTPLNGIIGLTEIISRNIEDSEKVRESVKKIESLGNQLLGLINDILEMSKMEQGKLEIKNSNFHLKRNLEELASIFQIQADNSGKQFICSIQIEHGEVEGDWGRIQQILNNLLSNAFKFTGEDGRIEFHVEEIRDSRNNYRKYHFTVSDNGFGMSQEFLKKIFVPFERETRFGAANVAGTGLGMPIVYELVQKMEGSIEVTSELGKGSEFQVILPLELHEGETLQKEESSAAAVGSAGEEMELAGMRVLLTEDNEINMEIAAEILAACGLKITQAWNGREALELYLEHEPFYFDFILMDMQMPVMDGCQAAERIRNSGRADARKIPIIAVTANAFAEDIALTRKAGMNAHISKPIDFNILKKTMAGLKRNGT